MFGLDAKISCLHHVGHQGLGKVLLVWEHIDHATMASCGAS